MNDTHRFCLEQEMHSVSGKHQVCVVSVFSDTSSGLVDLFLACGQYLTTVAFLC